MGMFPEIACRLDPKTGLRKRSLLEPQAGIVPVLAGRHDR